MVFCGGLFLICEGILFFITGEHQPVTGSRGPELSGSTFFKITKARGGSLRCTFSNLVLSPARQASRRGDTLRPSGPQGQHSLLFLSHLTDSLQGRSLVFLNSPSAAAGVVNLGAMSGWYPAWWNPCPVARGCEGFTDVPAKGGRDLNVLDGGLHFFKVRCSYSLPPTENS